VDDAVVGEDEGWGAVSFEGGADFCGVWACEGGVEVFGVVVGGDDVAAVDAGDGA